MAQNCKNSGFFAENQIFSSTIILAALYPSNLQSTIYLCFHNDIRRSAFRFFLRYGTFNAGRCYYLHFRLIRLVNQAWYVSKQIFGFSLSRCLNVLLFVEHGLRMLIVGQKFVSAALETELARRCSGVWFFFIIEPALLQNCWLQYLRQNIK